MSLELSARYTRTAIILHWAIAVMMIVNVLLALGFNTAPDRYVMPLGNAHKSIGILVLGLALMRILWRLTHQPPELDASIPRWQVRSVRAAHLLLYFLIVALPLSGWLYHSAWTEAANYPIDFFGLFHMSSISWAANLPVATKETLDPILGDVHIWLSYLLYVLFAAHVGGALKRQWADRVPTLERMSLRRTGRR
jgi:cytochrome b561